MGGGVVATGAMSAVMLAAQKAGFMGKMPPKKITGAALNWLRVRRGETTENAWSTVAHFAYGIGCGGVFGWLKAKTPDVLPAPLTGAAFGALVWAVSYFGWVPAMGIMPRPERDRPGRPTSMLLAHLVFGGVLGAFVSRGGARTQPA
jgi:hypothetical protein